MRKIFISLLITSISFVSFSQSKNVQNAYNSFRQEKDNIKTNISEAKYFIDLAYQHISTSNDPKMWNYRAQIYLEIITNHSDLDENAVFEATEAHIRCLDRDKKGRIVVRKWTREEDVLNGLIQCGYKLFNSGTDDYNNKKYNNAIKKYNEIFRIIPLDKDNLLKRGNIVPEAIYKNMYLASLQLEDEESQIEYLQKSIDLNTNDPMIYYYMSSVYSKKEDLQKALNYIQQGLEKFPSEIILINSEIDLLMKMGSSTEDIIKKLTDAIDIDNSNEILYIIRSQMYTKIGKTTEAESDLLEALDINSESASANNNLASFYLSLTEPIVKKLNDTHYSKSSKIASLEGQIEELHKKALPYLIKYTQIKENQVSEGIGTYDKAALNTLATIYYGLGMDDESTKVRNFLNSLK
ncbi:MAG: hypothetical protein CMD02_01370 [Flavobacteriales bacterium]|nr:hypothetical protein [Flavobacteriales bacterium]|tara:strand:+ start:5014 stop:6240 length:1227 start_codon:yes stop_codon:yes gene_type:complete